MSRLKVLYYKLKRKKEFDFSNVFCLMNLTYFIQDSGSKLARWRHPDMYSAKLFKSEKGTFGVDLYITGSPRENTFKVMVNMNEVTIRPLNFPWLRNFFKSRKSSAKAILRWKNYKFVIYQCNKSAWFCENIENPQDGNGEN